MTFCILLVCKPKNLKHQHVGTMPNFPYSEIRSGDLAFRMGTGVYGRLLKTQYADSIYYSHIGLIVQVDSQWVVIHAVPKEIDGIGDFERVKMETLPKFFAADKAIHGELVHTGYIDNGSMTEAAIRFVQDSVKFDSKFNLADSSSLYCTELIWLLYKREGIDLTEGRRSLRNMLFLGNEGCIVPSDILSFSGNVSYYKF